MIGYSRRDDRLLKVLSQVLKHPFAPIISTTDTPQQGYQSIKHTTSPSYTQILIPKQKRGNMKKRSAMLRLIRTSLTTDVHRSSYRATPHQLAMNNAVATAEKQLQSYCKDYPKTILADAELTF